jgi:uncharacterized membrane protein required for colicin V production
MNRHWKGVLTILLVASAAFGFAMGIHRPMWALFGVVSAVVIGYVLAIDWMRPSKPNARHTDAPEAPSPRP